MFDKIKCNAIAFLVVDEPIGARNMYPHKKQELLNKNLLIYLFVHNKKYENRQLAKKN